MRLAEALKLAAPQQAAQQRRVELLCGFEPLHLNTFVKAYLRQRFPSDAIVTSTGLYGDLEGNIQRSSGKSEGAVIVIEWSDLDPRLSFRNAGGWVLAALKDIAQEAEERAKRLETAIAAVSKTQPVVVVGPTLPLPPLTHYAPMQASVLEARLTSLCAGMEERIAGMQGVKLVSRSAIAMASPAGERHDLKMELQTGFPYTLAHADQVASAAVSCLFPAGVKKGLITDLDQTLWKGILGDAGVAGVSWSLEAKSQVHALYQQLLASLAESGVLLAVASKNDSSIVAAAMKRPDLLLPSESFFPVEASWEPKSEAVERILKAWNVSADSVVFVDDSPMELAEVSERHPGVECLQFFPDNPSAVLSLIVTLRERFGKEAIRQEDALRASSLRAAAAMDEERTAQDSGDFLERLRAKVRVEETDGDDARAFELVNKTNQFNLNGRRFTKAEWKERQTEKGSFLLGVSYEDRFGPLGRIAIVGGRVDGNTAEIDVWVMSCRAFSRRIEHATLRAVFSRTGAERIVLDFTMTDRNGPLQDFVQEVSATPKISSGKILITREAFIGACPTLFQEVTEGWTDSKKN